MNKILTSLFLLAASLSAAIQPDIPEVPEPSTYLMMAAGIGALAFARHRKSKKK